MMQTEVQTRAPVVTRADQITALGHAEVADMPVIIHGSLAHAVAQGRELPTEARRGGRVRDIDVFTLGIAGKMAVEHALQDMGIGAPAPLDAGLASLVGRDASGSLVVQKDGIVAELDDREGVFEQVVDYEVAGHDGLKLRSFTPAGLLAVHSLEPNNRLSHRAEDMRFERWCQEERVKLHPALNDSIRQFHAEYRARYPYGQLLRIAADIYVQVLPEAVRKHTRAYTKAFMNKYTGRENNQAG